MASKQRSLPATPRRAKQATARFFLHSGLIHRMCVAPVDGVDMDTPLYIGSRYRHFSGGTCPMGQKCDRFMGRN